MHRSRSPRRGDAVKHGMALVTEDRKRDGFALDLERARQWRPRHHGRCRALWRDRPRAARNQIVAAKLDELAMRPRDLGAARRGSFPAATSRRSCWRNGCWSGGTKRVLFDEPTRGVDIATKVEIYRMMAASSPDAGMAVLLISSEMPGDARA